MRKILKILRKILNITLLVLLVLMIVSNIYLFVSGKVTGKLQPDVFGWSSAVVISGSMEDAISVNDLVIVHRQPVYRIGDVISFENGHSVVTHRITGEEKDGFVTRGDANDTEDPDLVNIKQIVGKVAFVVPKAGVWIGLLKSPLGMASLAIIGLLMAALPQFFERMEDDEEN